MVDKCLFNELTDVQVVNAEPLQRSAAAGRRKAAGFHGTQESQSEETDE